MPGIGETLGLTLKADVSQWDAAFSKATVAAAKLGDQVEKAVDKAAKLGGMKWTDLTTGFNQALEIGSKLARLFEKGLEAAHFAAEMRNLEQRMPVARMKQMQDATEHAVSKMDLMKFSLRATTGELHLTERGLDTVLRAANTLGDQGFGDTMEIAEKLNDALRKGSSRGLREFGIALDDTADKNKNMNKALEAFKKLAETPVQVDGQLKALDALTAGWKDLANEITRAAGSALLFLGSKAGGALSKLGGGLGGRVAEAKYKEQDLARAREMYRQENFLYPSDTAPPDEWFLEAQGYMQRAGSERGLNWQRQLAGDAWGQANELRIRQAQALVAGKHPKEPKPLGQVTDVTPGLWDGYGGMGTPSEFVIGKGNVSAGFDALFAQAGPRNLADVGGLAAVGAGEGAGDATQGERLARFGEALKDQTTLVGGAFSVLSSGIGAAVEAAISGSESIGKAWQRASAMALKAIAIEQAVRATVALAMAAGAAVIGAGPAAAGFAKEAAMHAAAAAAAGIGAAALGGGGGGGGGGGPTSVPGGGNVSLGGGQREQATSTVVNVYGAITAGDYGKLGSVIEKATNAGKASGRVSDERNVTVHFE